MLNLDSTTLLALPFDFSPALNRPIIAVVQNGLSHEDHRSVPFLDKLTCSSDCYI
jgi:hypothetical protein